MINKIEFGQCLEELLNILTISGIKLAKAINVDPSLVSKWRNGKRVLSSKSNYLELIADYITKNIKTDYQKKEIIKFVNSLDISIPVENSSNFKKHIYNFLYIPLEYIIVPTVGTLSCIGSQDINKFDSAFLIKDKQSTEIQKQHIKQLLKWSSPLLNATEPIRSLKTSSEITLLEEKNGDRYAFKHDLSVLSIPLNLYEKNLFLNPNKMSDEEIQKRISFHKRRIDAFIKQIKHYKYYDICSKTAIEGLVENGAYTSVRAKPSDVLIHLKNVIYMLETYDNYQIALFNDIESDNVSKTSWLIKDCHNVLIQNSTIYKNVNNDVIYHENHKGGLSMTISEPTIVNAFKHHFMNLWSEIPPIDKDKKSVVSWFKNQIKGISKS